MTEKEAGGHSWENGSSRAVGLDRIDRPKAACVVPGELGSGDLWGGLRGRRGLKI